MVWSVVKTWLTWVYVRCCIPSQKVHRHICPPACYTMSTAEKRSFCQCLRTMKVPQGYSSNIKSLVSVNDLKLIGLKSHDCHVLMQHLLPVAIRGILPVKVRVAITRLCFVFNAFVAKSLTQQDWMSWRRRLPLSFVKWRCIFLHHFLT